MKKIYIIFLFLIAVSLSCTDDFEEMNTDTKNPAEVDGEFVFTSAQKELVDQISSTSVNYNVWKLFVQYWTETTYIDEANYDIVNRGIPEQAFEAYYVLVLNKLTTAKTLISESAITAVETEAVKTNKYAVIELLSIYTYHNLVNIFGDVPYTEALDPEDINPIYDGAYDIYQDLLRRLDAAYITMDAEADSYGDADIIYSGDIAAWKLFAQSLKLKIAINLADFDGTLSQTAVEEAVAEGVFASAADNALLQYEGSQPNTNPLHEDLVISGRNDFIPANTIVDLMNGLSDPRSDNYFTDQIDGAYLGGEYGYSNAYSNYSHINDDIQVATFPGILITYSEVQFYLAEAAERAYSVDGTAESFYNAAITASFNYWGTSGVEGYLAQSNVAYATADGDWKEKIGNQAYIALYTRGLTAYNTFRRLDYPAMNVAQEPATEDGSVPTRFTYPVNEQTLNAANYSSASTAIGGDELETKLFWDLY